MHILFVHPQFFCRESGVASAVLQVVDRLSEKNHNVDILTTNAYEDHSGHQLDGSTVGIYSFKVSRRFVSHKIYVPIDDFAFAVRSILKNYDIVHLNEYRSIQNALVSRICSKLNIPYLLQPHGTLTRFSSTTFEEAFKRTYDFTFGVSTLRNAAKIIALNEAESKNCQCFGISQDKIFIIPNGIALNQYQALPASGTFRSKYGIGNEERVLLYVGRIYWVKGIDVLIEAFARLVLVDRIPNLKLVLAGSDDGFLIDAQRLVRKLNLNDQVIFTGPIYGTEKLSAYVDSDIFVLPSRSEGCPMTLLEAYACCRPVVASNVGGVKSIVVNGETGLLVDPGDVEQLANSILHLLSDFKLARKMGSNGRRRVEENFSIDSIVDRLIRVYESVLCSNNTAMSNKWNAQRSFGYAGWNPDATSCNVQN